MSPTARVYLESLLSDLYASDPVAQEHREDLQRSGLTDETIATAKIRSIPSGLTCSSSSRRSRCEG